MKTGKIILYGFLCWLIPFVLAFFLYSKDGNLIIDIFLFKTIMLLVGNILGVYLMVHYFKNINNNIIKSGIMLSVIWLLIFWILDIIILLPMSEMSYSKYFMEIGLRYLLVPAISLGMVYSIELDRKK